MAGRIMGFEGPPGVLIPELGVSSFPDFATLLDDVTASRCFRANEFPIPRDVRNVDRCGPETRHRNVDHRRGPASSALAPVRKTIYRLKDPRQPLLGWLSRKSRS